MERAAGGRRLFYFGHLLDAGRLLRSSVRLAARPGLPIWAVIDMKAEGRVLWCELAR